MFSFDQQQQQIQSQIIDLNNNTQLTVYKIFGQLQFSFKSAYAQSVSDWSSFYTQFNPEHSLRYLTKKWDDGAQYACLVQLGINGSRRVEKNVQRKQADLSGKTHITYNQNTHNTNTEQFQSQKFLKLLKIKHPLLSSPKIPSSQKSILIKSHLSKKYNIQFTATTTTNSIQIQIPLMKRLGQLNIILQCIDCQEQQLIIPHDLLNQGNFVYRGCVQFRRSGDGMLRTVGWKRYQEMGEDYVLEDFVWNRITGQEQFQPYLLLSNNKQIRDIIYN